MYVERCGTICNLIVSLYRSSFSHPYTMYICYRFFQILLSYKNCIAYDYAHGSSAFLTWHRLYLLWFEREIRIITDDPKFKLSYWNWLDPDDRDILYSEDKLGSRNNNGYVISDTYGGSNWQPVCLYPESNPMFTSICNPTNPSAYKDNTNDYTRLQRPLDKNYNWPAKPETAEAIQNLNEYRLSAAGSVFNKYNRQSFSNYLEGWDPQTSCGQQMFCGDDNIPRRLHNLVTQC